PPTPHRHRRPDTRQPRHQPVRTAHLAAARASVRQARADIRRTLFGEPAGTPKEPQLTHRREPTGGETRTLGSSTTALTKD
ncbi:hypothetical protein ACFSJI_34490, partial [Streptomyces calvus]